MLARIFEHKLAEVAAAKAALPLPELRAMARAAPPPLGFRAALLRRDGIALIAEVKKASPSQGVIRADFDPVELAELYAEAGADALSVLTDREFFQGSPEDLRRVRAASPLPILRKDFIGDPYQLYEARAWGADAALLIVAALGAERLGPLLELAGELGMDALVEAHTESELAIALDAGADLIGVNNRSLHDFTVSLERAEKLLPSIGEGRVSVCESGLSNREDVVRVAAAGARAVLIGTAFSGARDVVAKIREVMGR